MDEASKIIEHHYNNPTQSQVNKALYQYIADCGITTDKLAEIIEKKMQEAVLKQISKELATGRFEKLVVGAVAEFLKTEKACYDREGGYGFHNRIKNLVEHELTNKVLDKYEISVKPKIGG